jgi:hypothetical protein
MFGDDDEVDDNGETKAEREANEARAKRMAQALKLKEEKDAKDGKVKKEKVKAGRARAVCWRCCRRMKLNSSRRLCSS